MSGPPRTTSERSVLNEALRRCRGAFGTVALFSLLLNLLVLAGPIYMLQVYGRVLSSGKVETLIMLTAILAVAFLVWATLDQLRLGVTIRIGLWLNQVLGPFYLDSGIRARLNGETPGAQAFRNLTQVQSFIATSGMIAFFDMPWAPIFIAVIWLLHPWLGILALGAALLLLLLGAANELATRTDLRTANEGQLAATRLADAAIRNAESVAAMGMGRALVDRWVMRNAVIERDLLRASARGAVLGGAARFLRTFFQSAILGLGAYLVIRGESTPGVMVAASILLGRALAPLDVAMSAWKSFSSARLAYDQLKKQAEAYPPEPRRLSLPKPRGGVAAHKITVIGPGGPILRGVSFEAAPGEAVAVIGPSAAGKSTLCKVLVGLMRPKGGVVRLDGTDIRLWNRDELGPHIGYLPQDGGLFAGTIRENIARLEEAPDHKVLEAAQLAHAHEMIARLPEGYETVIGDGGLGLSGGQRQRIGLARAIFGLPSLIVLDEPNSNLDQAGEAALAEAILELKGRGSTLLIVGHRPSTLAQADRILWLREGVVQAFGPRNEVLATLRTAAQAKTEDSAPARTPARDRLGEAAAEPREAARSAGGDDDVLQLGPWRVRAEAAAPEQ